MTTEKQIESFFLNNSEGYIRVFNAKGDHKDCNSYIEALEFLKPQVKAMEVYERIYDNPLNEDGTLKENKLLGEFELLEGDMNDYSYEVLVRSCINHELYILTGREVSGFYNRGMGGTHHSLEPLRENRFVKMYFQYGTGSV